MDNYDKSLKSKISSLPPLPGVYQFLDKNGAVLYIGKAKNLRARVGQYFNSSDERPQIPYLIKEAADFSYTVVNNELESLYLENTLIKQYLPKYNILLRDDKNYAFIKIDYSTQIPQIGYARKIDDYRRHPDPALAAGEGSHKQWAKRDSSAALGMTPERESKYFGPYSAAYKIRDTLHLTRKIFPYCSAQKVSGKPCFYYHLHRCPGICVGKITLDEYDRHLKKIEGFLAGNTSRISKQLKNEMRLAASKKQFEKAAKLRDQLTSLKLLEERQTVILARKVDWDVISMAFDQGYACVNLFKVRGGKLQDKENFVYETKPLPCTSRQTPVQGALASPSAKGRDSAVTPSFLKRGQGELLQKFLEQYYLEASSIPKIIYTQYQTQEHWLIEKLIRSRCGRAVKIITPQKGKAKNLIKLGVTNARQYLNKWLSDHAGNLLARNSFSEGGDKINLALQGLKDILNLPQIPKRIECYDISNIQGANAVGSMVVFTDGLPAKTAYRKFKIRSTNTPDDFAMMREMLERRFARSVIAEAKVASDLSAVASAKEEAATVYSSDDKIASSPDKAPAPRNDKVSWPLPDLVVIDGGKGQLNAALEALDKLKVKSEKFKVVGLAKRIEEIFTTDKSEPIILSRDNPALQLLQRLRDEAHRFGITFHRNLRSKQAVKSALDDIPGIGPKTKKLLKTKFGTVAQIKKASFSEIANTVGEKIAGLIQQS